MELSPRIESAGFRLSAHVRLGSTNATALEALRDGADRIWITAEEQVAGRGRHGRDWSSPPGNLYASLGLISPAPPAHTPKLGFVAGVALAEAIRTSAPASGASLRLKWPNDALVDGLKLAGILLEGQPVPDRGQGVAIGIGINVAHIPPGLADRATALHQRDPQISVSDLFMALADRMAYFLDLFGDGSGFPAIREAWLANALPIGSRLRIRLPSEEVHGSFSGIDLDGHLELTTETGLRRILAGDVFLGEDPRS